MLLSRPVMLLRDLISFMIYAFTFFRRREGVVTLLYHSVGRVAMSADPFKLSVAPEEFDRHLKAISEDKAKVKITFDDGYGNNFENAFPLLKKYGLDTTIFLITDFIDGKIGSESFAGTGFSERPLTWDEIRIMDKAGIKFGSHSKTHPMLTGVSRDILRMEVAASKDRIEKALGHRIESFGYPFGNAGSFNKFVKEIVSDAGYDRAYTNIMGSNDGLSDTLALKRVRIYRGDSVLKLKMKISGAYDWVDSLRKSNKL